MKRRQSQPLFSKIVFQLPEWPLIILIFSNEFLRSLLRDAQTQNLFNLDASSSSDSISSVEDGWRELEDKLNSTANDVESRLSTPEDIHRYLEQSIDDFDLESENTQAIIPESFHDDLDWMSETSNESGHLNLASSTDEALLEADFRALSPEVRFLKRLFINYVQLLFGRT